jgi:DNA-binding MarR family transcriptional regulator
VPGKSQRVSDVASKAETGRKHSTALAANEYGDDVLSVLRKQWISTGRKHPDFDEFVSGLTILNQYMEREGGRNLRNNFKMSGAELRILLALVRVQTDEGLRPTDLFRHLLVSSGAVTKQLDRLEARGLIRRQPDPRNIRGFRIRLTPEGEKLIAPIIGSQHHILPTMERMFNNLSPGDREHTLRLLHILTRDVQEANRLSPFD